MKGSSCYTRGRGGGFGTVERVQVSAISIQNVNQAVPLGQEPESEEWALNLVPLLYNPYIHYT